MGPPAGCGQRAIARAPSRAAPTEEQQRHESRALDTWVDDDGMAVVRGRLTPEVGAVARRALEAALDAAVAPASHQPASRSAADVQLLSSISTPAALEQIRALRLSRSCPAPTAPGGKSGEPRAPRRTEARCSHGDSACSRDLLGLAGLPRLARGARPRRLGVLP